jgi:hypothetical protein
MCITDSEVFFCLHSLKDYRGRVKGGGRRENTWFPPCWWQGQRPTGGPCKSSGFTAESTHILEALFLIYKHERERNFLIRILAFFSFKNQVQKNSRRCHLLFVWSVFWGVPKIENYFNPDLRFDPKKKKQKSENFTRLESCYDLRNTHKTSKKNYKI